MNSPDQKVRVELTRVWAESVLELCDLEGMDMQILGAFRAALDQEKPCERCGGSGKDVEEVGEGAFVPAGPCPDCKSEEGERAPEVVELICRERLEFWDELTEEEKSETRGEARRELEAVAPALRKQGAEEERERLWKEEAKNSTASLAIIAYRQRMKEGPAHELDVGAYALRGLFAALDQEKAACPTCDDTGWVCAECGKPRPRCTCGLDGASEDGCPERCEAQGRPVER